MPVLANQSRSTSNTSSATKYTPQSGHLFESIGTNELQAPHSPRDTSDTPDILIPHSLHSFESRGIIALHEPHSAIGISFSSSSDIVTPICRITTHDIMING